MKEKIILKMKYFFKMNYSVNEIKENIESDKKIYENCDFLNEFENINDLYEKINSIKPEKINESPYVKIKDCIVLDFLNLKFCENYLLSNQEKNVINNVF
jgi:predicted nuclease of restriction endonuclease-like (RecB) superfamily